MTDWGNPAKWDVKLLNSDFLTESMPHIVEGPIGTEAIVIDGVAAGAIDLWSPVILTAAGTGEDLPRVNTTTTAKDPLTYGVVVGPKLASGRAADAAGDKVNIVRRGRAKVKVNGKTTNIAIGDGLHTTTTAGIAVKAAFDVTATVNQVNVNKAIRDAIAVFAVALKASTADADIIPADVRPNCGVHASTYA